MKKVIHQHLGSERHNHGSANPRHKFMGLFHAVIPYSTLSHSFQIFGSFYPFFFSVKNF